MRNRRRYEKTSNEQHLEEDNIISSLKRSDIFHAKSKGLF
jgi:hypothetical protein